MNIIKCDVGFIFETKQALVTNMQALVSSVSLVLYEESNGGGWLSGLSGMFSSW